MLVTTVLLLALPTAAPAAVESAALGNVSAQLSYDTSGGVFSNLTETISRNGVTVVSQSPAPYPQTGTLEGVAPAFAGRDPAVHVLRLDPSTSEPAVVFDLFSGGAHCCFYSQIFVLNPSSSSYSSIVHDWLDPGYEFKDRDGDGIFEFSSADGRFAYAFGSFAASRFPPQVWKLSGGELIDVTRQFPQIIRADLRSEKRNYKAVRIKFDARPPLAALTADECLLGSCSKGFGFVRKSIKRGDTILGKPGKFLSQLKSFLRKTGYR